MPGTKSSDSQCENDVPGRHYAIGHAIYSPPQAYCLPGRIVAIASSEDFVPGYYRYAQ